MKQIFFYNVIFILLLLTGCNEKDEPISISNNNNKTKYFYYYKGEKIYLTLNTEYLFISSNIKQIPEKYSSYFKLLTNIKK